MEPKLIQSLFGDRITLDALDSNDVPSVSVHTVARGAQAGAFGTLDLNDDLVLLVPVTLDGSRYVLALHGTSLAPPSHSGKGGNTSTDVAAVLDAISQDQIPLSGTPLTFVAATKTGAPASRSQNWGALKNHYR